MTTIRTATVEDFDILSNLEQHISVDILRKKIERKEIIVILENSKIIGWLRYNMFWDEHPFMNMLYILEEHRNNGFGKKIVSFWEEKMKEKGFVILMVSTLSTEGSQHFYRNIGYKDIGGFIMPKEPLELIMIKELYS